MLRASVRQFMQMRASVRALIFLHWIYAFAGSMIGVFTQIFIYQQFTGISHNIYAILANFTGTMIALCIPGYLAAHYRINIKHGFSASLIITSVSVLYLLFADTERSVYFAMFLFGVGQGFYWLTANTLELSETRDDERDLYSSMLGAGHQFLGPAGPALGTILIWLSSNVLGWGTYTLIFATVPAVYLLGFVCMSGIPDYRPLPIEWADVQHFFRDRSNQIAQIYMLGNSIQDALPISTLVTLLILGTPLLVGVYSAAMAIVSAICLLVVARYRTSSNRLLFFCITSVGVALAHMWLGYAFTFTALIIFTLVRAILGPLLNVSVHVLDLKVMETGRTIDFYATMIFRDFFLWVGRCVGGVFYLFLASFIVGDQAVLSMGLYLMAGAIMLSLLGAVLFIRATSK